MTPTERAAAWERLRVQLEDAAVNWLFYLEYEPDGTHHRARYAAHEARLALDAYEALRADDTATVAPHIRTEGAR